MSLRSEDCLVPVLLVSSYLQRKDSVVVGILVGADREFRGFWGEGNSGFVVSHRCLKQDNINFGKNWNLVRHWQKKLIFLKTHEIPAFLCISWHVFHGFINTFSEYNRTRENIFLILFFSPHRSKEVIISSASFPPHSKFRYN